VPIPGLETGNPTMTIEYLAELASAILAGANGSSLGNAILGDLRQTGANAPARSNIPHLGGTLLDGALNGTEVATVVMVPVKPGDVITTVKLAIGKTAGVKCEAGFAALYAGHGAEPALLGQSKSGKLGEAGAVPKEKPLSFTLEAPITITEAMAPYGYVYVAVAMEAETMPTCIGVAVSKESQALVAALTTNSPLFLGAKAGSALKTTAKAKIETPAAVVQVPVVVLS
jgi:hypothetical protein